MNDDPHVKLYWNQTGTPHVNVLDYWRHALIIFTFGLNQVADQVLAEFRNSYKKFSSYSLHLKRSCANTIFYEVVITLISFLPWACILYWS
jgi:hypothetical protein